MASWTLHSSAADVNSGAASPRTVNLPTNSAGDLMLLFVEMYEGASSAVINVTTGGWTEIANPATRTATGTGNNRAVCWARISAGSEASVTYTQTTLVYIEGAVVVLTPSTSAAALVTDTPDNSPNPSIGHTAADNTTSILDASVSVGAVTDAFLILRGGWTNSAGTNVWTPTALTKVFSSDIDTVTNVYWGTDFGSTTIGTEQITILASEPWFLLGVAFKLAGGAPPQDTPELYGRPRLSGRQMQQLLAQ